MRRRQSSIWLLPAILQPLFIYFRFILLRFLVSLLFNSKFRSVLLRFLVSLLPSICSGMISLLRFIVFVSRSISE